MEAAFGNLQKEGKNDVDNIVKWMKDSKVVDDTKEQEDKLRSLFNDVPDKKNVSLDQFKGILQKFCDEFKKNMEGLATQLATTAGASMVQSLAGTATAGLPGLLGKK